MPASVPGADPSRDVAVAVWIAIDMQAELALGARAKSDPRDRTPEPALRVGLSALVGGVHERVELGPLGVAVDDPGLGDSERGVEGKLGIGVVPGASDLHHHGGGSVEVLVPVDGKAIRGEEDDVRDAVVVRPAAAASNVDLVVDPGPVAGSPVGPEIRLQGPFEILVDACGRRNHPELSVPHLIEVVGAGLFPSLDDGIGSG